MIPRRQIPALSPITVGSIVAGVRAILGSDRGEEEIRRRLHESYGSHRTILVDSGTSALALAIAATVGERDGLPVALPGFGCFDLATAADAADVPVRLYDVDPETLGPDFASLRRAVARGVSAIVVAPLYGIPVDLREVEACAGEAGVDVIEDAAQGFGASFAGSALGSRGAFGVLSFGRGKGLTGGGGGALLCRDDRASVLVARVARLSDEPRAGVREVATASAQRLLARPRLYWIPASVPSLALGESRYLPPHPVRRASRASLAVAAANWRASIEEAEARRRNAGRIGGWIEELPELKTVLPPTGSEPSYLRFPIRSTGSGRSALSTKTARGLGVMPSYPKPLFQLPGFSTRCAGEPEKLTGSRELASNLVTLPTHSMLTEADLDALGALVGRTAGTGGRATIGRVIG